jgi:hypothetical protein
MKCQSFPYFVVVFALTFAWGPIPLHAADDFLHYYGRGKALDLAQGVKAAINTQPLAANK